ncbi:MAG: hypothetical protein ABI874_10685 [Chloroflexota bacterium]
MPDSKFFYLPTARILPQTRVSRERLLPRAGEALVSANDRVEPVDVVARALTPASPKVYNIARLFKVSSFRARNLMLKQVGESFDQDEVLARKQPLLYGKPYVIRAPWPGRVLAAHDGDVLLEAAPALLELQANIKGSVVNASSFGVVLQTLGALVQGAWGNGKESYGVLKALGDAREQALTADSVDVSCLGAIILVGGTLEPEGLKQAEAQQVRGVIAGSMAASLRAQALVLPFPVMITEGFGALPMAPSAYELLRSFNTREAALRAVSQTRWGAQRPEVVVPLTAREATSSESPLAFVALQADVKVRVCAGAQFGRTGHIVSEMPQSRMMSGGARARAVEVELSDGDRVWVAINNLEAIA